MSYRENLKNNLITNLLSTTDSRYSNLIKDIPSGNINEFVELLGLITDTLKFTENYEAVNFCGTISANIVPPSLYYFEYIKLVLQEILSRLKVKKGYEKIHDDNVKKILEYEDKYKEMSSYLLNYLIKDYNEIAEQYCQSSEKMDENLKKVLDEKNSVEYIPITKMKDVKLYHGTSYDNYLQIKESGVIKPSNYDDGNYHGYKNVEAVYLSETGYVFTSDSMDFSLKYCFGGYRKNLIEKWAYDTNNNEAKKNINLGVIFEIDPANYKVYLAKAKREFVIEGEVSINDTKPIFYLLNNNYEYIELSEDEINKIWSENN